MTVWGNEKNDFKAAPALVKAIPALVDVLEHDHDESIRADAAKVLGRIGPIASAAVPALRDATKDQSAWVRSEAGEALTKVLANRQPPAKDELKLSGLRRISLRLTAGRRQTELVFGESARQQNNQNS